MHCELNHNSVVLKYHARYLRTHDKLRDPKWLLVLGKAYQPYQPEYFWFSTVFLLRRWIGCEHDCAEAQQEAAADT